jgi:hypothetical protein
MMSLTGVLQGSEGSARHSGPEQCSDHPVHEYELSGPESYDHICHRSSASAACKSPQMSLLGRVQLRSESSVHSEPLPQRVQSQAVHQAVSLCSLLLCGGPAR